MTSANSANTSRENTATFLPNHEPMTFAFTLREAIDDKNQL